MESKSIRLDLSFDDVNKVLQALGNLPFNEVYELIAKIHEQANTQQTPTSISK